MAEIVRRSRRAIKQLCTRRNRRWKGTCRISGYTLLTETVKGQELIRNSVLRGLKLVPPHPHYWPSTSRVLYTTICNTQSSAPEDGQNNCPKHVELIGIINKPLLLHLVGCLYYLYFIIYFFRLPKQSQFIPLNNVVYFITLPFLVHKIFTFYTNDELLFKCPFPGPKG